MQQLFRTTFVHNASAVLTFGKLDDEHCIQDEWFFVEQLTDEEWMVALTGISFSKSAFSNHTPTFIPLEKNASISLDGLPIELPKEHYVSIMHTIGADPKWEYMTPIGCDKLTNGVEVTFWFGVHSVQLTPRDYIQQVGWEQIYVREEILALWEQ
jgi:hypothetical protein